MTVPVIVTMRTLDDIDAPCTTAVLIAAVTDVLSSAECAGKAYAIEPFLRLVEQRISPEAPEGFLSRYKRFVHQHAQYISESLNEAGGAATDGELLLAPSPTSTPPPY